jgi:phosphatidylserine/phosphatidylglycerophosphate/cardiolipin synthase-like enzyme
MKNFKSKTYENFSVLKGPEFLDDLESEAKKATRRVFIKTMILGAGIATDRLLSMYKGTKKSVDKKFHVDWIGVVGIGNLDLLKKHSPKEDSKKWFLLELKKNNVELSITNRPKFGFAGYVGRNHMKIVIVDDITYLGGVNISDRQFFSYVDFMVKIVDENLAQTLSSLFTPEKKLYEDRVIYKNKDLEVVVDAGIPRKSLIFEKAVSKIKLAKKNIIHISQFLPDGKILHELEKLYINGAGVSIITPRKNQFNKFFVLLNTLNKLSIKFRRVRMPIILKQTMIHAKLTIIDDKTAIFGSHNLSQKGVMVGTSEIAVFTSNPKLIKNLSNYYDFVLKEVV